MPTEYYVSVSLGLLLISLLLFSSTALAMGTPPSACNNRYDGKIVSMIVDNGFQKLDVLSDNGTIFIAKLEKGYGIIFVLEPVNSSSSGNTVKGSSWYTNTAYGFSAGNCIDGFYAGKNKTVSVDNIVMGQARNDTTQKVTWGSWPDAAQVTYTVHWQP